MAPSARFRLAPILALCLVALSLGGCGHFSSFSEGERLSDRECLARVMYFESNRSSDDGMRAVGTVVMNRLSNPRYPKTVCGVVGQPNQFAQGALTNPVSKRSAAWARAEHIAESVLGGDRHEAVGSAMFFHTAGYTFPYRNMHYLTLAGGNAFYEKRTPGTFTNEVSPVMVASAAPRSRPVMMAQADIEPPRLREADADDLPMTHVPTSAPARPIAAMPPRPIMTAVAEPRPIESRSYDRPRYADGPAPRAVDKPKPIVVAMLAPPPKPHPARPRSIEDLIAMDLAQQ